MSALRIASIPVLVLLASRGERDLYLVCLAISLSTDLLDGLLARLLNQRTELGAKLDLWGDVGVLLSMPFALWRMWPEVLHSERWLIGAALASYAVSATLAMCKFCRLASYHSWLGKTAVMVLALGGFAAMFGWTLWLLRIGLLLITAAIIEEITISLLLTEARSDIPSWWHARRPAKPNKPSEKKRSAQFRHNKLMQPTQRIRFWKRKWFRRIFTSIAALLVLLPMAGAVYQWTATRIFDRRHPPRGELIDVGGHRLHIHRQGKGSPVVVIDAGLAGGSYEWDPLAAEISAVTEVCTYDRAGYGWSDRGPSPRNSERIVAELHTLLEKARVKPPFILVGHSFGGQNIRLYASKYPNEVAGLVLVDAVNHDVMPDTAPIGQVPKLFPFLNWTAPLGISRLWAPSLLREPTNNPDARAFLLGSLTRTKSAQTIFEETSGQTNWQSTRSALKHLKEKPAIVISRRMDETDFIGEAGQLNRQWFEGQKALTNISSHSKRIVSETKSHFLQFYEPKLIVGAVRELVESIRSTNVMRGETESVRQYPTNPSRQR